MLEYENHGRHTTETDRGGVHWRSRVQWNCVCVMVLCVWVEWRVAWFGMVTEATVGHNTQIGHLPYV